MTILFFPHVAYSCYLKCTLLCLLYHPLSLYLYLTGPLFQVYAHFFHQTFLTIYFSHQFSLKKPFLSLFTRLVKTLSLEDAKCSHISLKMLSDHSKAFKKHQRGKTEANLNLAIEQYTSISSIFFCPLNLLGAIFRARLFFCYSFCLFILLCFFSLFTPTVGVQELTIHH